MTEQANLLQQKIYGGEPTPCLIVEAQPDGHFMGRFAYKLNAVVNARSEDEVTPIVQMAQEWNFHFLNFLHFIDPSISLCWRYLSGTKEYPDETVILLLVSVEASSEEEVISQAGNLCKELLFHLPSGPLSGKVVYQFSPISQENDLRYFLTPFHPNKLLRLTRKDNPSLTENPVAPFLPPLSMAETAVSSLKHFCKCMAAQTHPTFCDVLMRPVVLSLYEVQQLLAMQKKFLRNTENDSLSPAELNPLLQSCYMAEMYVAQEKQALSTTLLSAIATDFFGSVVNMDSQPMERDISLSMFHHRLETKASGTRFPSLYLGTSALRLFRLPYPMIHGIPGVYSTHPAYQYLPSALAHDGPIIGLKHVTHHVKLIRIAPEDLRRHVYILGQTGTGKTTLLYSMIRERIASGAGIGLIDPHGDLIEQVYQTIPEDRKKDVILFEPGNIQNPPGLNMLEYDVAYPEQKSLFISQLFDIFDQKYDLKATGGPMFEQYMRNAMLLVMDEGNVEQFGHGTLMDITMLFNDENFRKKRLDYCKDTVVKQNWIGFASRTGEASLSNMTNYITSKINTFVQNHYVSKIVSQRNSVLRCREMMDEGKIFLANLSKGKLGAEGLQLLGTILFGKFLAAALSRENIPESQRSDFSLFVDEFQNFTSPTVGSMLSEARKYRLSLILANQTLGQLKKDMVASVLGNVGNLIFFRPGINDMEHVRPYVNPQFGNQELLVMPNFTACARLLANNRPAYPFMFQTLFFEDVPQPAEDEQTLISEVTPQDVSATETLGQMVEAAVAPLVQASQDSDCQARQNDIDAVGQIKDAREAEPLIRALKDQNWKVRSNAALSLGKMVEPRAVEPLILALEDRDSDVRRCAAMALGKIRDARAVEPLTKALKDQNDYVRRNAAWALGRISVISKMHYSSL